MKTNMNTEKKLLFFILSIIVLSACCRQSKTQTQREDVSLNNKGFEFLQVYYDECVDEYLDSARFYLEKALECNDENSTAFFNLMSVLGIQEEYGIMVERLQQRMNGLPRKAFLAKAETYSELAMLYDRIGDTVSNCEMVQNASTEFEKCFSQKPISVDLVISFLLFVA